MLTAQLFELWGTDSGTLVDLCREHATAASVVLGGSLADDIGTMDSDIDLYYFPDEPATGSEHDFVMAGERILHLHAVHRGSLRDLGPGLWQLLDRPHDLRELPAIAPHLLSGLHALASGTVLADDGALEQLRVDAGADLLGSYLLLRHLARVRALRAEGGADRSRELLQAAADAYLVATGLLNPNAKWRLELLGRALLARPEAEWLAPAAAALRAPATDERPPYAAVAERCLAAVCDEPVVRMLVQEQARTGLLERGRPAAGTGEG